MGVFYKVDGSGNISNPFGGITSGQDISTSANVNGNNIIGTVVQGNSYLTAPFVVTDKITDLSGSINIGTPGTGSNVYFQNSVSGYSASAFNYYEETSFTMVMMTPANTNVNWQIQILRIGNLCTLTWGTMNVLPTLTNAPFQTLSTYELPTRFRPTLSPTGNMYTLFSIMYQGNYIIAQMNVATSGVITILQSNGSGFSVGGVNNTIINPSSFSYIVA